LFRLWWCKIFLAECIRISTTWQAILFKRKFYSLLPCVCRPSLQQSGFLSSATITVFLINSESLCWQYNDDSVSLRPREVLNTFARKNQPHRDFWVYCTLKLLICRESLALDILLNVVYDSYILLYLAGIIAFSADGFLLV